MATMMQLPRDGFNWGWCGVDEEIPGSIGELTRGINWCSEEFPRGVGGCNGEFLRRVNWREGCVLE